MFMGWMRRRRYVIILRLHPRQLHSDLSIGTTRHRRLLERPYYVRVPWW